MAHILVVDDEPHIRELISIILKTAGHEVETADSGTVALAAVDAAVPDVIVLDLAMPGMDGWRVLEELHRRGIRRRTRVVIVSGHLDQSAVSRGQGVAVRHFLPKPFDADSLVTLVEDALEQDPNDLYVRRERTDELVRLIEKMEQVLG